MPVPLWTRNFHSNILTFNSPSILQRSSGSFYRMTPIQPSEEKPFDPLGPGQSPAPARVITRGVLMSIRDNPGPSHSPSPRRRHPDPGVQG